ncbi:RNA polymerase II elongation factor ELL2 [Corythoichthys intestinalis]|uniref:RNA polymerase II elongation factor ELL2 n=1 Tax=Corythoichthys intestinalis TaxID=161448 RepID=UPI0025A683F3|nr:RNA polymerase II elongation factor ELL2 [Corythoichthys intestinalis]XP_061813285.1 RNA polymerase II elongation factor ELL2-like [Nerophis lumbriciformis]
MAALRQERRYGLSCGKINKNSPNRTLYHVKLTDTALRTLETYQNLKASLPNQTSICFKGSQGYIKIPTSESPDGFRVFSFYLSCDSKDKPQSSFDCIHQFVSGEGKDQLEGQGSIQDKITVCATDDSYQATRERMSQVEKDIWSRSAIEIKPGPSKCVKVQRKQGLVSGSDSSNKRSLVPSPVAQRPLRDRIIHLLALKHYKKPELLLWLERERASPKDKADLTSVLDEVGKLNLKDNSYSLKDELYRHVQRDWPGYLEEEKQLIHRLLIRKLQPLHSNSQLKSPQTNQSFHKTPGDSPSQLSPAKTLSVKRPLPLDQSNCQTPKKQRLTDHCLPRQSPSHRDYGTNNAGAHDKTNNHLQACPNGLHSPHKLSGSSTTPKAERTEPAPKALTPKTPHMDPTVCTEQQLPNGQHKKKKSKKHKEKERERLKPEWIETSPDLKKNQDNLKGEKTPVRTTKEDLPDYLLKYSSITALEQREQYKNDFCSEYDEYRALHDRIGAITEMFVQLGSKINTLSPGTQEYKLMEEQILQKYRKYKKKFPGYREEKKRCEYLHQKLSHIKGLILDFDRAQELS